MHATKYRWSVEMYMCDVYTGLITQVLLLCCAESGIPHEVVAAFDINPVANSVYRLNFPTTKLVCKCLTVSYGLNLHYICSLNSLMSL